MGRVPPDLIRAIAAEPDRPYYESWAAALEALAADKRVVDTDELRRRAAPAER